ncbi:hypothetical protein R4K54_04180 [Brachyspira murdochii]|uniref:hypothetical protein n=1 Tax=Brachyspira TaxID=29521 RepID=UPI000D392F19|nr:hypothetical protein [Brachyspira hampsonii]PTY41501.1 hypothetical protein DQ06_00070 [Brachyspira hampsonii bv. II]
MIDLKELFTIHKKAFKAFEDKNYNEALFQYKVLLALLEDNKQYINDYNNLKLTIENNIDLCNKIENFF